MKLYEANILILSRTIADSETLSRSTYYLFRFEVVTKMKKDAVPIFPNAKVICLDLT